MAKTSNSNSHETPRPRSIHHIASKTNRHTQVSDVAVLQTALYKPRIIGASPLIQSPQTRPFKIATRSQIDKCYGDRDRASANDWPVIPRGARGPCRRIRTRVRVRGGDRDRRTSTCTSISHTCTCAFLIPINYCKSWNDGQMKGRCGTRLSYWGAAGELRERSTHLRFIPDKESTVHPPVAEEWRVRPVRLG